MKWFRILGVVAVVYLVSGGATNAGAQVTPVDELNQKIHKEFGLVGQWTITKMDISRSFAGAAGAAQASYDIGSSVVDAKFSRVETLLARATPPIACARPRAHRPRSLCLSV
jgi:hypothetical protein